MINRIKFAEKKALATHVEMILSFIIFIGFVIFLLYAFPVYKSSKSTLGLDAAERGISNFVSMEMNYFTIVLNKTLEEGKTCFCFENNSEADNVVAIDELGNLVGAYYSDGNICINNAKNFTSVYSSADFRSEIFAGECDNLDEGDYLIGLDDEISMVSYNKTLKLIERYNSDYENLKTDMSIPAKEDFGFKVTSLKGEEILGLSAMKTRPAKTQVLAASFPCQIAYENGSSVFAMINVQEW